MTSLSQMRAAAVAVLDEDRIYQSALVTKSFAECVGIARGLVIAEEEYRKAITPAVVLRMLSAIEAAGPALQWLEYIARFNPELCTATVSTEGLARGPIKIGEHVQALREALAGLEES